MTLRSFKKDATEWHTVSDYPEQPNAGTQPKIDSQKEERMRTQHYKHKLLNTTIVLSKDS